MPIQNTIDGAQCDALTVAYNACYAIGLWSPDGMMSLRYNWHINFSLLLLANSPDGCLLCNCEFKLEVLSMLPHRRYFMRETGHCQEEL